MLLLATLVLAAPCVVRPARASPVLDGEIRALALAGDRMVALRDGEAWLLTAAGVVIGKMEKVDRRPGDAAAPAAHPRRRPRAEDVVDLLGLPDDDLESDLVREALEDEGSGSPRRRRARRPELDDPPATGSPMPAALAASRDAIWIAGEDGLRRLDADGGWAWLAPGAVPPIPRRRALAALAVTPDGQRLAVVAGHEVWRSTDGAHTWSLLAVPPTRPRALVLPTEGDEVYVLDEEGVAILAHRERFPVFTGSVSDLAWCGHELLIAGADGLFAWRWDVGLERRGERLHARRLGCTAELPGVVLAVGPELALSRDGGRSWLARTDLPATEIESVTITATTLWLGTRAGLYRSPLAPLGPDDDPRPDALAAAATARAQPAPGGAAGVALPAVALLRWRQSLWCDLLPAVSLVVSRAATRPGGDRGAIWLLLTLPLGAPPASAPRAARLAEDLLRRRADAAAALTRAALTPGGGDDEPAALARLARERLDEAVR